MRLSRVVCATLILSPLTATRGTAQALETETARLLPRGAIEVGHNFEFQTSSEGRELALPFALEIGLTNRLEFLLEPVAYTAIRPKVGPRATGPGDIEATLTYLLLPEAGARPALATALEVKIPTASNSLIGTGRADYAGYLIASRRFGKVDVHANVSYTIVGRPAGVQVSNILGGAAAAVWRISERTELFTEVLAHTAATPGSEVTTPPPSGTGPAELIGAEAAITGGVSRQVSNLLKLSGSVSLDNNGAVLLRPGFQLRFHL